MIVSVSKIKGKCTINEHILTLPDGSTMTAADCIRLGHRVIKPYGHQPNDITTPEQENELFVFWSYVPLVVFCKRCFWAFILKKNDRVTCPKCHSPKWNESVSIDCIGRAGRPRTVDQGEK